MAQARPINSGLLLTLWQRVKTNLDLTMAAIRKHTGGSPAIRRYRCLAVGDSQMTRRFTSHEFDELSSSLTEGQSPDVTVLMSPSL